MWRLLKVLPKSLRQKCGPLACSPASGGESTPLEEAATTVFAATDLHSTKYCPPVTRVTSCVEHQATNSILTQDAARYGQSDQVLRLGKRVSSNGGWRVPHWEAGSLLEALGVGFAILLGLRYGLRQPAPGHRRDETPTKTAPTFGHPCCPLSALLRLAHAVNPSDLVLSVFPAQLYPNAGETKTESVDKIPSESTVLQVQQCEESATVVENGAASSEAVSPAIDESKHSEDRILSEMKRLDNDFKAHVLYMEARDLLKQKRPYAAFEMFEEASELGLLSAMFNMAVCYEKGVGVDQDLQLALEWYEEAANRGHSTALYNMAVFFLEGKGVEVDTNLGLLCMQKACDAGVMEAQTFMGLHHGKNFEYAKAVQLFEKAAQQKHADGQYLLGLCYENGLGVEENTAKAADLFAKSASANNVDANYRLATYYELGLGGLPEDSAQAQQLYEKAAQSNHEMAINRLKDLNKKAELVEPQSPAAQPQSPVTKPLRTVSSTPNLSAYENNSPPCSFTTFDFTKVKEFIQKYLVHPANSHAYRLHVDDPAYVFDVESDPLSNAEVDNPLKAW